MSFLSRAWMCVRRSVRDFTNRFRPHDLELRVYRRWRCSFVETHSQLYFWSVGRLIRLTNYRFVEKSVKGKNSSTEKRNAQWFSSETLIQFLNMEFCHVLFLFFFVFAQFNLNALQQIKWPPLSLCFSSHRSSYRLFSELINNSNVFFLFCFHRSHLAFMTRSIYVFLSSTKSMMSRCLFVFLFSQTRFPTIKTKVAEPKISKNNFLTTERKQRSLCSKNGRSEKCDLETVRLISLCQFSSEIILTEISLFRQKHKWEWKIKRTKKHKHSNLEIRSVLSIASACPRCCDAIFSVYLCEWRHLWAASVLSF